MDTLAEEKDFEIERLDTVFKQIKMDAKATVVSMKKKLDSLLVVLIKELDLIQEEQILVDDEKSETIKTFLKRINQLQNKTKIVRQYDNLNQMFIHFERSKSEFKSAVKEASRLNTDTIGDANFALNEVLDPVVSAAYLGKIDITKMSAIDNDQFEKAFYPTGSVLLDETTIKASLSVVKEASKSLNTESVGDTTFVISETLESDQFVNDVGKINITKKSTIDSDQFCPVRNAQLDKNITKTPLCAVKIARNTLERDSTRDAKLVLKETKESNQVVDDDNPGEINITKKSAFDCDQYQARSALLDKTRPPLSVDNICLQHRKTVHLPGFSIYACVYISDEIVILGGKDSSTGKIKALDISNENVLAEYSFFETIKRLEYDIESKSLFLSCYNSKLFSLKFNGNFNSEIAIKTDNYLRNGDLCLFEGILYIIVHNSVQSISIGNVKGGKLQSCFTTNTECTYLNGLVINCKNKHLLHTSNGEELLCTSLEGELIFSYKDEQVKRISSLAVHPQGVIFIGSRNGVIYAVCENGKQMRILLDKCKEFRVINDICFNNCLAVCGSTYLEIYDVIV